VNVDSNASFLLTMTDGYLFQSTDYASYQAAVSEDGKEVRLTLLRVHYSCVVEVNALKTDYSWTYDANGGTRKDGLQGEVQVPFLKRHLRVNTGKGTDLFEREGYTLTGWNTKPDGSGTGVGLGSRTEWQKDLVLYAQWKRWTDPSFFLTEDKEDGVWITSFSDSGEKEVVVPGILEGKTVTGIESHAFSSAVPERLILPITLKSISKDAFSFSSLKEVTLYDSIESIDNEAFSGCPLFSALHLNAAVDPVYSGNYFDTFQDKYDRLLSLKDKKKIVLFSGSSTRFGFDSALLDSAFEDYDIVNMGVYAYSIAKAQMDLILPLMKEGDIFLSCPEFDAIDTQFSTQKRLDRFFFAMMESDYDTLVSYDLRDIPDPFSALTSYLTVRKSMTRKSYELSPSQFDEEGKPVTVPSYNVYGDYSLYRPNATDDSLIYGYLADYTVSAFPETVVSSLNETYQKFLDKGVKVYFSYAPRNILGLRKEATAEKRAELDRWLRARLSVPVISPIEESLYLGRYLYGTDNHLSTEGAEIRTKRVIQDLETQQAKEGSAG
jgi:hypothetical protein